MKKHLRTLAVLGITVPQVCKALIRSVSISALSEDI
jgi:hypothetical protein